jgi:hypothetical protein
VRKVSDEKLLLPTPESIAQETKRLRTRYKIINEIVQTEKVFLSDMHVLDEYYGNLTSECPVFTIRHKQTIFGRIKNILSFGNGFYKELVTAAGEYATLEENTVIEARFDELLEWNADTTIGETFWSSVRLDNFEGKS